MKYTKEYLYRQSIILAKSMGRQDKDAEKRMRDFAELCLSYGTSKEKIENIAYGFENVCRLMEKRFVWLTVLLSPIEVAQMRIREKETVNEAYAEFMVQIMERYLVFCRFHPNLESDICLNALEYILTKPYEKVDLAETAEYCYVNYSYLSHHLKKDLGKSFVEYVVELKLQIVKNMLTGSSDSIRQIAKKVGYEDFKYLGRLFKKKYGTTMSDYRLMNSIDKVS